MHHHIDAHLALGHRQPQGEISGVQKTPSFQTALEPASGERPQHKTRSTLCKPRGGVGRNLRGFATPLGEGKAAMMDRRAARFSVAVDLDSWAEAFSSGTFQARHVIKHGDLTWTKQYWVPRSAVSCSVFAIASRCLVVGASELSVGLSSTCTSSTRCCMSTETMASQLRQDDHAPGRAHKTGVVYMSCPHDAVVGSAWWLSYHIIS